ncbi:peroxiredoxin type-2 [Knufia fluminis]|uniref:Thioredoxin peroxidase n=1 Tax=Knufia fluminis TaxID=191047 RepID=A0AAN8EV24_9EURO|nr:peroxiredoxin type-2 [Knufia fluminis]
MAGLKEGDTFPEGVEFSYIPWTPENDSPTSCGIPISFKASEEFKDKKVVLFAVPGAFTPGCSVRHLPGYIEKISEIRGKGVDLVCVLASNDAFVMSAWGKVNGIKDEILFLSDPDCKFSKSIGWDVGVSPNRTARYAMVVDHGKVVYAEKEPGRDVTVSGALAVLAKL